MMYMCSGYSQTAEGVVGRGLFDEGTSSNVVLVRDIDVFSLCEHHMLPFIGKVRPLVTRP
jgi:GTP cyclohydrolase I